MWILWKTVRHSKKTDCGYEKSTDLKNLTAQSIKTTRNWTKWWIRFLKLNDGEIQNWSNENLSLVVGQKITHLSYENWERIEYPNNQNFTELVWKIYWRKRKKRYFLPKIASRNLAPKQREGDLVW